MSRSKPKPAEEPIYAIETPLRFMMGQPLSVYSCSANRDGEAWLDEPGLASSMCAWECGVTHPVLPFHRAVDLGYFDRNKGAVTIQNPRIIWTAVKAGFLPLRPAASA